jgi:hypothetical protein
MEARDGIGRTVKMQDNLTVEDLVKALDQNEISVKPNEAELEMVRKQEEYNKTGDILKKHLEKLVKQSEGQQKAIDKLNDKLVEAMKLNEQYRDKKDKQTPEEKEYYKKAVKKGSIYVHDEGTHKLLEQMIPLLGGKAAGNITGVAGSFSSDLQKTLELLNKVAVSGTQLIDSVTLINRKGELGTGTGNIPGIPAPPNPDPEVLKDIEKDNKASKGVFSAMLGWWKNWGKKGNDKDKSNHEDLKKIFGMDIGTRAKEKFRSVGATLVSEKAGGVDVADKLIRAMNLERLIGGIFNITGAVIGKALTAFLPEVFNKISKTVGKFFGGIAETSASIFLEPLKKQLETYSDIRQVIDQTTRGLGLNNKEIESGSIGIKEIRETGQDINTIQKEWIKNWKRGIQEIGKTKKVLTTGLSTAYLIGSSASETSDMFSDWHQNLRLSVGDLGIMGRGLVEISKSTGVTGDNLLRVAKSAGQLMQNMKDAGTFTTSYGKMITKILAEASKVGAEDIGKEVLQMMQGGLAFGGGDESLKRFMTMGAGAVGPAGGMLTDKLFKGQKLLPEEMKQLATGMERVIQDMIDDIAPIGTNFKNLNEQQREDLNFQMKLAFGEKIKSEKMLAFIESMRKGSKTFAETLEDLTKEGEKNISAEKTKQIEQEKSNLITSESLDLFSKYNDLLQTEGPNALKKFMEMPGVKESLTALNVKGTTEPEVLKGLLQPVINNLNKKITSDPKLSKTMKPFDSNVIKDALDKGAKGIEDLFENINEVQNQIIIQQKANLDPVKALEFAVNQLSGSVQELASNLTSKFHESLTKLVVNLDNLITAFTRLSDETKTVIGLLVGGGGLVLALATVAGTIKNTIEVIKTLRGLGAVPGAAGAVPGAAGAVPGAAGAVPGAVPGAAGAVPVAASPLVLASLPTALAGLFYVLKKGNDATSERTDALMAETPKLIANLKQQNKNMESSVAKVNADKIKEEMQNLSQQTIALAKAAQEDINSLNSAKAKVDDAFQSFFSAKWFRSNYMTERDAEILQNQITQDRVQRELNDRQKTLEESLARASARENIGKTTTEIGEHEKKLANARQEEKDLNKLLAEKRKEFDNRGFFQSKTDLRIEINDINAKIKEATELRIEEEKLVDLKKQGLLASKVDYMVDVGANKVKGKNLGLLEQYSEIFMKMRQAKGTGWDAATDPEVQLMNKQLGINLADLEKESALRQELFGKKSAAQESLGINRKKMEEYLNKWKDNKDWNNFMRASMNELGNTNYKTFDEAITNATPEVIAKALQAYSTERPQYTLNTGKEIANALIESQNRLGKADEDIKKLADAGLKKDSIYVYDTHAELVLAKISESINKLFATPILPGPIDPEAEIKRRKLEAEERNKPIVIENDDLSSIEETNRTVAEKIAIVADLLKDIKESLAPRKRYAGDSGRDVSEEPYNDGVLDTEWVQARFDEMSPGLGGEYTDGA